MAGIIVAVSLVTYFSIEYFVSGQFRALHEQRLERLGEQARTALAQEQRYLTSLVSLLARDSDLRNSTFYHLYLDGEQRLPQAAIDRLAEAFRLTDVALRTVNGEVVALRGAPLPSDARLGSRIVWAGDEPWLVAGAEVVREEASIARLEVAEPITQPLRARLPGDVESFTLRRRPEVGKDSLRIADESGTLLYVDAKVSDPVQDALVEVQRLLLIILLLAGMSLATTLALVLRRQLRPLRDLAAATERVGRGDFTPAPDPGGDHEIAKLVRAFNQMTRQLDELRNLQTRLQQTEQLSAIGRMAARVAHDLNNPLTVIRNVAQLQALDQPADTPLGADLRLILHHCERSTRTIQQLLEFGRPIRPRTRATALGPLLQSIANRWLSARPATGRLDIEGLDQGLIAEVDPFLLEQALDNLLDNAFAAGAPVWLSLTTAGSSAAIHVRDSGPGFDADAIAHLFEPFFTAKRGGTGLGLASCRAIARALSGDVTVVLGRPGQVTLTLPLTQPVIPHEGSGGAATDF